MKRELPMANNAGAVKDFYCAAIVAFRSMAGGRGACSLARNKMIDSSTINWSPPASVLTCVERGCIKCNEISNRLHLSRVLKNGC
jgi:hypothetical protein